MNFLNSLLLGGTAALLAPLLIHLLNRTRLQTVEWGAMHLLEAAVKTNTRRLNWESLWLLLVRCAIPVLLALALARPVLKQFTAPGSTGGSALVLLLDNSLSMDAANDQGTLFQHAKLSLAQIAEHSVAPEFSLWSSGASPTDQLPNTTLSRSRIQAALEGIEGGAGSNASIAALGNAIRQAKTMANPYRQVVLASDFQASQWRNVSASELNAIHSALHSANAVLPPSTAASVNPSIRTPDADSGVQLFLLPLLTPAAIDNLSIEWTDREPHARKNETYRISVAVKNHALQASPKSRVVLTVDGQDLASRNIELGAGDSEQMEFACQFADLGWHGLAVHIEDTSSVQGDDWAYAAVHVTAAKRIIIVDDLAKSGEFAGASRYLQLALAPFNDHNADHNPFEVEVLPSASLDSQQLSNCDAVIVAHVAQWRPQFLEALRPFVQAGGGLLVFAHNGSQLAEIVPPTGTNVSLLPMRFGEMQAASRDAPGRIGAGVMLDHELSYFRDRISGLSEFEFTHWRQLESANDDNSSEDRSSDETAAETTPTVLLTLTGGAAWLVSRDVGRGRVLQCASSCDMDTSSMPLKPAFVPLMVVLADLLTQQASSRSQLVAGQAIELRLAETDSANSQDYADPISIMRHSGGLDSTRNFETTLHAGRAVFEQTDIAGLYEVRSAGTRAKAGTIQPQLFSVSANPAESELESLSSQELASLAQQMGATLVESPQAFFQLEKLKRDGRELWRWFLLGVLGLLFLELGLLRRISVRDAHGPLRNSQAETRLGRPLNEPSRNPPKIGVGA